MKVNFLMNYCRQWDLESETVSIGENSIINKGSSEYSQINSSEIQKVDLVLNFNGKDKLDDFLPVQSKDSYNYEVNKGLLEFTPIHILNALQEWKRHLK